MSFMLTCNCKCQYKKKPFFFQIFQGFNLVTLKISSGYISQPGSELQMRPVDIAGDRLHCDICLLSELWHEVN